MPPLPTFLQQPVMGPNLPQARLVPPLDPLSLRLLQLTARLAVSGQPGPAPEPARAEFVPARPQPVPQPEPAPAPQPMSALNLPGEGPSTVDLTRAAQPPAVPQSSLMRDALLTLGAFALGGPHAGALVLNLLKNRQTQQAAQAEAAAGRQAQQVASLAQQMAARGRPEVARALLIRAATGMAQIAPQVAEALQKQAEALSPTSIEPFTLSSGETRFVVDPNTGVPKPIASVPTAPETVTLSPGQTRFRIDPSTGQAIPVVSLPPRPDQGPGFTASDVVIARSLGLPIAGRRPEDLSPLEASMITREKQRQALEVAKARGLFAAQLREQRPLHLDEPNAIVFDTQANREISPFDPGSSPAEIRAINAQTPGRINVIAGKAADQFRDIETSIARLEIFQQVLPSVVQAQPGLQTIGQLFKTRFKAMLGFPEEATFVGARRLLELAEAAVFNQGRPSDKDREAVAAFIPGEGDSFQSAMLKTGLFIEFLRAGRDVILRTTNREERAKRINDLYRQFAVRGLQSGIIVRQTERGQQLLEELAR